jgi:membrane-associated phospholipid phosphatase
LLARALFNTQGELLRGISGFGAPTLGPKSLDINRAIQRWAPDVRQRLYQFQLASALYMPYSAARQKSVTLWYRTTIGPQGGGLRARYAKLVTLRRPRYDYRGSQLPAPPGSPGGTLPVELQAVFDMIPLRPERTPEILAQVSPPYSFFASVLNLQAGRRRRTFELLTTANTFASVAGQQLKHAFRVLRPADRSSLIQPMIATPGHGSYPAGHATQCEVLRHVLTRLLNLPPASERSGQLVRLSARIAENRIVAGLHYPADNAQGVVLGGFLAWYFLNKCVEPNTPLAWLWNLAKAEQ